MASRHNNDERNDDEIDALKQQITLLQSTIAKLEAENNSLKVELDQAHEQLANAAAAGVGIVRERRQSLSAFSSGAPLAHHGGGGGGATTSATTTSHAPDVSNLQAIEKLTTPHNISSESPQMMSSTENKPPPSPVVLSPLLSTPVQEDEASSRSGFGSPSGGATRQGTSTAAGGGEDRGKEMMCKNPNQLGRTIDGPDDRQWYISKCMQLGLINCLVSEDAAMHDITSPKQQLSLLNPKVMRERRSTYFHLHNDHPKMTNAEPTNLPLVRDHNTHPALLRQFGSLHTRVVSDAGGHLYDVRDNTDAAPQSSDVGSSGGAQLTSSVSSNASCPHSPPTTTSTVGGTTSSTGSGNEGGSSFLTPLRAATHRRTGSSEGNNAVTSLLTVGGNTRQHRPDEYRLTLHGTPLVQELMKMLNVKVSHLKDQLANGEWRQAESPGKSEATFFFFGDFVVKSLKESEYKFAREKFMMDYAKHVSKNPHTLLPQILAVFTLVNLRNEHTTRYVLMNNVFSTKIPLRTIFDLKGSTVGRDGGVNGPEHAVMTNGTTIFKDNDLNGRTLMVTGPLRKAALVAQARLDCNFLEKKNVVDYSLLVGVRSRAISVAEAQELGYVQPESAGTYYGTPTTSYTPQTHALKSSVVDSSCLRADDGGLRTVIPTNHGASFEEQIFYMGIIDVFQTYSPSKRFENFAKGLLNDKHQISVVPPDEYHDRLCKLVERICE